MKARLFTVFAIVMGLALVLIWAVAAQGPEPAVAPQRGSPPPRPTPAGDWDGEQPFRQPVAPADVSTQAMNSAVPLGQPGLSFRYLRTFGETGVPYFDDADHLNNPAGVGTDGTNVWITEGNGRRALKYASDGTFLMKIGKAGFGEVAGTTLNSLTDVAVDSSGDIWVVDRGAHHVIKFNSSGSRVSELGVLWGPGTGNDRFNQPYGIAFDNAGNIYISDSGNHRIQVFNSSGVYSTTIGVTGVPGLDNVHFNSPRHIAVDSNNRLYVADANNHRVQIFNVSNILAITHLATIGVSGESGSDNAHFNSPQGVAVDVTRGWIYVADLFNGRVQVFDYATRGYLRTLTGWSPHDVAVDSAGNLYVADAWNHQVRQFDSNLNQVRTYGTPGVPYLTDGSHYNKLHGVAVAPDGSIYIGEDLGARLIKLNAAGVPQWIIGEAGIGGSDNDHFAYVTDVALDAAGRVYAADPPNCRIQIYNSDGSYYGTLGTGCGIGDYQFKAPHGVAIGPDNTIYVADSDNHRVQVFNSDRVYVATLGETGVAGSDNAHFNSLRGVEVDSVGNVYVADLNNHRVQVFNSDRVYVRTIGETGVPGDDFGHLSNPPAVAVDAVGRIYVADQWGGRVQVFDNSGAYLTTIGGSGGNRTGQMRGAEALAMDAAGNLYVAESENARIQKFAPGVPGWVQSNINGFGSPRNLGILSLTPFHSRLYAGTFNPSTGAQLWRLDDVGWTAVITDGFGSGRNVGIDHLIEFNGYLYAGTWNYDYGQDQTYGGEVWRSADGERWTRIADKGFGVPTNGEVFRFAVFSDTLYAGTRSYADDRGAEIWRSRTGIAGDWNRAVENGLSNPRNSAVRTFEVFSDTLFAGISNYDEGGEIWRSTDGLTWTQVLTGGFGSAERISVAALASFENHLYASTTGGTGAQVWRCQACDGSDWEKVVADGFGNRDNSQASALEVFDNHLYFVVGNLTSGLEVWRTGDGVNWEQLVAGGFGDSNNISTGWDNAVAVFNGSLYAGTWNSANGGEVWQKKVLAADFTASPTEGVLPLTVTFTNTSTGDYTSSLWDFGDGITSTLTNPTHTYTAAGVYTVTLTVSDGIDTSTMTKAGYINVRYGVYLPLILRNY